LQCGRLDPEFVTVIAKRSSWMKTLRTLALGTALLVPMLTATHVKGQVSFPGPELLGRPTSDSVTVNVVAAFAIDAYFQYGSESGAYSHETNIVSAAANEPLVAVLSGLAGDTRYYYRMMYRPAGAADWIARDEHSFVTQRARGSTFTFTITSDSHVNILLGDASLFQQTLSNVAADRPDFHLDLGDTFAMDNVTTEAQARNSYLYQRAFMGLFSHSSPLFLVLGNHEEEEGWHRDDTGNIATSKPLLGANARIRYFLNPVPNAFYSGNTDASWQPFLGGDGVIGDYYAWEWGNALFVVIDPYWYTTTKPFIGNTGGGEDSDPGSGDRWDWTLGWDQYQWLERTLEASNAPFKFIFAHHGTGGTDDYIRGGANAVPYTEWGGNNEDGVTWAFDSRRPGWPLPVHQLLVQHHVTAFFHGHDHEFAHEERDGIVYQLVPMAADRGYGFGFQDYHESDPYTIRVLPNSGHLRVTVADSTATVDYVRAFLPGDGANGEVSYSYEMHAASDDSTPPQISSLSATPESGGTAAITWTTDEPSDSRVDFGPSAELGSSAAGTTRETEHLVRLSDLAPATTYYYRVTSVDAAGNSSTEPKTGLALFTTPANIVTASPAGVVIARGTRRRGNLASLAADDEDEYVIGSARAGQPAVAAVVSFAGVPNGLSRLQISQIASSSQSCSQTLFVWNWTARQWLALDTRSVDQTEASFSIAIPDDLVSDLVSGRSGGGQLRVQVRCTGESNFLYSWDQLHIEYAAP
jgi:hypothetical protein